MENLKLILENTLKAWNENHKPKLAYIKGQGLNFADEDTTRIRFYGSKSICIDVIDFLTQCEYQKEKQ